jgi:SAM-dependent methyltransferase
LSRSAAPLEGLFGNWEEAMARYQFPTEGARAFYARVYRTSPDIYLRRLRATGFEGHGSVLDAGCGYGQWSLALASLNGKVVAADVSHERASVVADRARETGADNLEAVACSIDALPMRDSTFDAVFCYGAIFFVDYRVALEEFARVLRPGGRLYFCANDLGWFLWYLISNHNAGQDFRPRRIALETFRNSAAFYLGRTLKPGSQLAIPKRAAARAVAQRGFAVLDIDGDGQIGAPGADCVFFAKSRFGIPAVYEVLAERNR